MLLWTVPYIHAYRSIFLGHAEDRQLILVASDADSYTAWSINVASGRAMFTGRFDSDAVPVAAPVMGLYSLTVPVLEGLGVRYEELAAGRFSEGSPCTQL